MPVFLVMNLVQPLIWLLLFGQLFKSIVEIPGFGDGQSYLEFLTPGIVMMMALFGSAWAGTVYIQDMDRGVMDRFLTSPTNRGALMVSTLIYQAILTIVQSLIVRGSRLAAGRALRRGTHRHPGAAARGGAADRRVLGAVERGRRCSPATRRCSSASRSCSRSR